MAAPPHDLTAKRAGVSQASLIRFERTDEVLHKSLANISIALETAVDFFRLFAVEEVRPIDELVAAKTTRQRGRK